MLFVIKLVHITIKRYLCHSPENALIANTSLTNSHNSMLNSSSLYPITTRGKPQLLAKAKVRIKTVK